jgi:hypothetical protein
VNRLFSLLSLLLMVLIGLFMGLSITWYSLVSTNVPGAVSDGPWVLWPKAGAPDADPYSLATHARRGDVPMAQGEGLALFALRDSSGKPLRAACSYAITGHFPTSRVWSVAVYDPDGRLIENAAGRYGMTSAEAVVEEGQNRIQISASAMPGNWLPVAGDGTFVIVLRFYDTPLSAAASALDWSRLPRLAVTGCSS